MRDYRAGAEGETVSTTFSLEELKAMVETAHDLGRPVAAHSMNDEAMRRCCTKPASTASSMAMAARARRSR